MPGRTIDNGYGKEHRQLRAEYARRMKAGEVFRCWRCGSWVDPEAEWDLGHDDHDRSAYRGPEHVYCNRSNAKRTTAQLKSVRYRGKIWRRCEVCGKEYRPSNWRQRTCGRECGGELRRRNRPPRPKVIRSCLECGQEFETWVSSPRDTCSGKCAGQRKGRRGTRVLSCVVCGKPSTTKTCSAECYRTNKRNQQRERAKPSGASSRWQKLLDKNR